MRLLTLVLAPGRRLWQNYPVNLDRRRVASAAALAGVLAIGPPSRASAPTTVDTLTAVGGLPAHMVGQLEAPIGFVQTSAGEYLVLDRRQHTVYGVDAAKTKMHKVLQIGFEQGRVLEPGVLAMGKADIFAVADAPSGNERIQYFTTAGQFLGGFYLQSKVAPRIVLGPIVINGVGSMAFADKTFLVNRPDSGALISEFDVSGAVVRHFGTLRRTGFESDRDVHLALNIGLPLVDPTGGYYFVFQTGAPMFQKYDAQGALVFERHIEGIELDASVVSLPTVWPRAREGALPIVPPLVRTAAVDARGQLWVSLMTPFTYVYDTHGEKTRTVQFHAASLLSPASLFFTPQGRLLVTPGCYEFVPR
jgi:hypothetical protein